MAGLQAIKKSIHSAENLKTIVATMKAHASANINQFQNAAKASMEYRHVLDLSLYVVFSQEEEILPLEKAQGGNRLHIVFGSDHGLAGRFNERIAAFAFEHIPQSEADQVIVIGQQVVQRLQYDRTIYKTFMQPQSTENISSMVNKLLVQIDALREEMPLEKILLYYNKPHDRSLFVEMEKNGNPKACPYISQNGRKAFRI